MDMPDSMTGEGLTRRQAAVKRAFDIVVSALGLLLGWPLILFSWIVARLDTQANGFYFHERIGRDGMRFKVIKIRTMREIPGISTTVTTDTDPRITPCGRFFRKSKLDELPQLINVLKGDMSLVGPRPDAPGFADELKGCDRLILTVRPGITGPASLQYRNEEELLATQNDPEQFNREVIFPDKVRINCDYIKNYRFRDDLRCLWRTVSG
jgi:lipopolysaccharide/colanic/teichoic acid biosynthesis glycosyltransferase